MKQLLTHLLSLKLIWVMLSLLFLSVNDLAAQSGNRIAVSGTITSAEGKEPLIGATILEKGISNGTTTDVNGKFSLTVPANL